MGCWNSTCGISNLPITAGEPVYVILLAENPFEDKNYCHVTSFYQPMGFYFEGKYNDYGSVTDIHGTLLQQQVEMVRDNLVELEVGENQYHDIAVKKNSFNLLEASREGRLFIKNLFGSSGTGRDRAARLVFIKKGIFEGIVNNYNPDAHDYKTHTKTTFDELFNRQIYDYQKEAINFRKAHNVDFTIRQLPSILDSSDGILFGNFPQIKEQLQESTVNDSELFHNICENLKNIVKLQNFLHDHRKLWMPTCGEGSQAEDYNSHKLLMKLKADIIAEREAAFADEQADDGK